MSYFVRGAMPIISDPRHPYGAKPPVRVSEAPALMFSDASARQAPMNHAGATLDQLRDRGGITAGEAVAIIACLPALHVSTDEAHYILYAMRCLFERSKWTGLALAAGEGRD